MYLMKRTICKNGVSGKKVKTSSQCFFRLPHNIGSLKLDYFYVNAFYAGISGEHFSVHLNLSPDQRDLGCPGKKLLTCFLFLG